MAASFRNYLGKFALMATLVLWASCSDADKNADKSPEQENSEFEFPVDSHGEEPFIVQDFREIPLKRSIIRKPNGAVSAPTSDEMKSAGGDEHDKDSILKVIRQRTPGLRHIYNKHLKKNRAKAYLKNNQDNVNPNFNGMIVFKLNVNADGSAQKVEIQSSNTGNKDFDDEVKRALSHWKFPKLKSSEVVTFPLVFFENTTPYKKPTSPKILF